MRTRPFLTAAVAILAIMTLMACGAMREAQIAPDKVVLEATMVVEEVAPAADMEQQAEAGGAAETTAMPAATLVPESSSLADSSIPRAERMIIKNAELELLVANTDVALDGVTVIAADYGGYIISSHTWFEDEFKFATVRLGVPVTEFENVLRRLRGLGLKVLSEIASGEDVTDQYVDLESRLTNLRATRDRIREFLDRADKVEEALQVNEQLSQVEAQIEEIQGRMNYLKDRAAFSTIDVQLNPERPTPTPTPTSTPTPTPTPVAWRPGETFKSASNVLGSILKGLADLAIWMLVVLGPFLIPVALVIWLVIWLRRRKARRSNQSGPPPENGS